MNNCYQYGHSLVQKALSRKCLSDRPFSFPQFLPKRSPLNEAPRAIAQVSGLYAIACLTCLNNVGIIQPKIGVNPSV
ncbi:MAG TPA: hypothetical protein V6C57_23665 [Coleofasciculaceae cyanobacterium]